MQKIRCIIKLIVLFVVFAIFCFSLSGKTNAVDYVFKENKNVIAQSKDYASTIIDPVTIPGNVSLYNKNYDFLLKLGANSLPTKFDLRDQIQINVYNQGSTNDCWIYSTNSLIETTRAKEKNEYLTYNSDYTKTQVSDLFHLEQNEGGNASLCLALYTNGYGPLTNETQQIDTQIGDYVLLSSVYKSKDDSGNTLYNFGTYTEEQVKTLRNKIKEHIMEYGAVTAAICSNPRLNNAKYYSSPSLSTYKKSKAYFCNYNYQKENNTEVPDHQVTIIGWDDNYSRDNFNEDNKPEEDGAYLVLNSWGEDSGEKGYIYISYEDTYVESMVYRNI